uniref:Aquaporin 7 n=1 Tax=Equus asinus TaxID=9793 RepID=A0A9L0JLG7_EQUAS
MSEADRRRRSTRKSKTISTPMTTRIHAILEKEMVREFLAEFLSTYVMMVLVTGMLQLCLFAITDKRNNPALQGTQALVIGILVVVIGVSLGMNTGYAINPSRDLPPRFFTFLAGWGIQVFRAKDWWWVPVVAPPLGAYLGGIIYLVFIGSSNPWEAQMLENPGAYEDRRISVLPKTSSYPPNSSSLTPVSVSPSSRPSIRPVPPLGDSVNLEQF